jgi:hypothetical protein
MSLEKPLTCIWLPKEKPERLRLVERPAALFHGDHPQDPRRDLQPPGPDHGRGRSVRSFSSWAYEEGFLEDDIVQRLKLPRLPTTRPEPLSEEDIRRVLAVCLDHTLERLRNYSLRCFSWIPASG